MSQLKLNIERSSSNLSMRPRLSSTRDLRSETVSSAGKSIIRDYKVPYVNKPLNNSLRNSYSHKDLKKGLEDFSFK